jgi:hypothetical protein
LTARVMKIVARADAHLMAKQIENPKRGRGCAWGSIGASF